MGYKKYGIYLLIALGAVGGLGMLAMVFTQGTAVPGSGPADNGTQTVSGEKSWSDVKTGVGLKFPSRTASENVVMVKNAVNAENYGSPDVGTVGADSDESDTTELFASSDVESNSDYYEYTTFGSTISSNLPSSGTYKVAVIGTGIVNEYVSYDIKETNDYAFRVENNLPLKPLSELDIQSYAADADISTDDTFMVDGSSTISLDSNFTDDANDGNVDGSVTGVKEYSISGSDKAIQLGNVEVSSVNSNVQEVTMTVMVDGEQVHQVTDSDLTDSNKLNDQVEFGTVTAEDSVEVRTQIKFDDSALSSSTALLTSEIDDADDDSTSDDGSYGIIKLTQKWSGY